MPPVVSELMELAGGIDIYKENKCFVGERWICVAAKNSQKKKLATGSNWRKIKNTRNDPVF